MKLPHLCDSLCLLYFAQPIPRLEREARNHCLRRREYSCWKQSGGGLGLWFKHFYLLFTSLQWILIGHLTSVKHGARFQEWRTKWYLRNHSGLIQDLAKDSLWIWGVHGGFCQVHWPVDLHIVSVSFCANCGRVDRVAQDSGWIACKNETRLLSCSLHKKFADC